MKPAWTMIALMSSAVLLISGCGIGEANTGTAPLANEESTPLPVVIDFARTGPIDAVYEATANLEALERADVVARIEGEIIEILVEEGAFVSAGQVLARLEPARLRLKVDRARAERDKLRQEYKRNLLLHERGLVSPRDYEDLDFQVKVAEAAYDLALLELSYTEVKAPIAGVVSERFAKTGNRLSAGEPLFAVTNTANLVAYVHVPQGELAKFAPAQSVSIRADALPSQDFRGQIERVSPIVDSATGTAKLTVAVDDESLLRPGMFVRLELVYATHEQALLVPRDALDDEDGETRVWVIENDKASGRSVTTGLRSPDWVEITSGLAAGERLIVEGLQGIREGTHIAATASEPRPNG